MMDVDATSLEQLDVAFKLDVVNIIDSCRICMTQTLNMSSIFDTANENIVDEILFCTGITIKEDAGLPSQICEVCRNNLSIAYKFKTTCLLADETYKKLVPKIKDEVPESGVTNSAYARLTFKDEIQDDVDSEGLEYVKTESDVEAADDVKTNVKGRNKEFEDVKIENELEIVDGVLRKSSPIKVKARGRPRKATGANAKPRPLRKFKFRRLCCEVCNLKFDTKEQSNDHKRQAHKDMWICEVCGKSFIHRASHYTHVKSHQPPNYGCDQCDYKTWHKSDLVKHVRIHAGLKLYQCEYCSTSYYTSSNLTSHIRRLHMKERLYDCSICKRTFFDKTKLNRHLDSHFDIKRFECNVCHACFTRRCYWKKHLLRQHDIVTPPQRPGRQKTNEVIGDYLEKQAIGDFYQKGDLVDSKES
ncbi:zinc finger protein 1 homolog [Spodoptera litura]|uniref:Zinc finger protein 1 homolog n=1 Tax=Spodoptera litura TaxID=69820 RepID=A0A9J7DZR1_SPOLT|nr:zinc finger protein 1 homolog [Spodoptera litura]